MAYIAAPAPSDSASNVVTNTPPIVCYFFPISNAATHTTPTQTQVDKSVGYSH